MFWHSGDYYSNHSNETAPTSPAMSGGSLNMQNATTPSNTCDCNNISNVQEMAPTDAGATSSPGSDASSGSDPSSAASGASSSK